MNNWITCLFSFGLSCEQVYTGCVFCQLRLLLYQLRLPMSLQRIIFVQPLILIILRTSFSKHIVIRSVIITSARDFLYYRSISFSIFVYQTPLYWMRNLIPYFEKDLTKFVKLYDQCMSCVNRRNRTDFGTVTPETAENRA